MEIMREQWDAMRVDRDHEEIVRTEMGWWGLGGEDGNEKGVMSTCGKDNRDQERMVEVRKGQDQQDDDMKFWESGCGTGGGWEGLMWLPALSWVQARLGFHL